MKLPTSQALAIRPMQPTDLDQIVAIDLKVLGRPRPEYWEMKLELAGQRPHMAALVAEHEGQVVGFIIGGASRWEYGMPTHIGWIDTIGVDPDFQRKGVARALFTPHGRRAQADGGWTPCTPLSPAATGASSSSSEAWALPRAT